MHIQKKAVNDLSKKQILNKCTEKLYNILLCLIIKHSNSNGADVKIYTLTTKNGITKINKVVVNKKTKRFIKPLACNITYLEEILLENYLVLEKEQNNTYSFNVPLKSLRQTINVKQKIKSK